MPARPIIIDCDPGVDDSLALMMALGAAEALDLRGICTVAGNVSLELCTRNALGVLALSGRNDIPVFEGCPSPMLVDSVSAGNIHGETGLGGASLPASNSQAQSAHAAAFIIDTFTAPSPHPITLVLTGPMTNLATALVQAPHIANNIAELIIMGGAQSAGGNITPSAEFNIYADPHAAKIVLGCGAPTTLIGLDATLQFRCTPERHNALSEMGTAAGQIAHDMIAHVNTVYGELYGTEGAAMHDPCTIGYLLAPDLFTLVNAHVAVETDALLTRGHTAVNLRPDFSKAANVRWATSLDAPALFNELISRISQL